MKKEINRELTKVLSNFKNFQSELREIAINSKNLEEYSNKLNEIEIKHGC